jgi:hypothetical protein
MAYNKFKKLDNLRKELGINDLTTEWLPSNLSFPVVTDLLISALKEASQEALITEKAKSESIIVPIIKELRRQNPDKFSFFSGYELNIPNQKDLKGYCDFILSSKTHKMEVTAPIFCLVEAKDGKVEKGLAQCGAEMYASILYNEMEGTPRNIIYGCVTNAFSWCFLKLEHKTLYIDPNYVPLTFTKPYEVLAVLQWILDESLKA